MSDPRSPPEPLLTWADLTTRPRPHADATLSYGADPLQRVDVWLPRGPGPHPVVLMVHGGCWQSDIADRTLMDWAAADLRAAGVAVWNIDYRGVDRAGGGYPGTFADAAHAADLLRAEAPRLHLDLSRVVALGHSAGGHLALWLAARPRLPRASVLWSAHPLPIAHVVSLGGLPDLEATAAAEDNGCGTEVDRAAGRHAACRPPGRLCRHLGPAAAATRRARRTWSTGARTASSPIACRSPIPPRREKAGDAATLHTVPHTGHVELIAPGSTAWAEAKRLVLAALRQ